jgi:hypothetical protein
VVRLSRIENPSQREIANTLMILEITVNERDPEQG